MTSDMKFTILMGCEILQKPNRLYGHELIFYGESNLYSNPMPPKYELHRESVSSDNDIQTHSDIKGWKQGIENGSVRNSSNFNHHFFLSKWSIPHQIPVFSQKYPMVRKENCCQPRDFQNVCHFSYIQHLLAKYHTSKTQYCSLKTNIYCSPLSRQVIERNS